MIDASKRNTKPFTADELDEIDEYAEAILRDFTLDLEEAETYRKAMILGQAWLAAAEAILLIKKQAYAQAYAEVSGKPTEKN